MFLVGCGFLVAAGWSIWSTVAFRSQAVHVSGVIIDPRAHPRVRFTALDGAIVEFQQHVGGDDVLGAPVPIVYLPNDPAGTAHADTFSATWIEPLGFLWIGLAFTVLPAFGVRAEFRGGRW